MIPETGAMHSDQGRAAWLDGSLAAIRGLRAEGLPLIGYTWFPLYTMIDWRYRFGTKPAEAYRIELGLYSLDDGAPDGRWRPTPLLERFQRHMANPAASIGPLGA